MVPDLACFALLLAHDHESVKRKDFFPICGLKIANTASLVIDQAMAAMLQIPRVFPRVSCRGSAKAVQCPCPGPKIGDKSQQIPRYSPVCPRGHPPGMAADKCIIHIISAV